LKNAVGYDKLLFHGQFDFQYGNYEEVKTYSELWFWFQNQDCVNFSFNILLFLDTRKTMTIFVVSYTHAQWMEICEFCVARELISTLFPN